MFVDFFSTASHVIIKAEREMRNKIMRMLL